ncbi:hypothetical protein ACFS5J_03255 [Flavobacterium chuncheonense]|uniref:Uncharacterized protein n=1 Tax=Flavobacterium chuncheonense TaxID=2026653 RepID=A0ABW5YJU8_9FLAO
MNNRKSKKIAAISLIVVPCIKLISYLGDNDFEKYGMNNYIICGALFVLMLCGTIGLKNSLYQKDKI